VSVDYNYSYFYCSYYKVDVTDIDYYKILLMACPYLIAVDTMMMMIAILYDWLVNTF
jgi:hypothetical protein